MLREKPTPELPLLTFTTLLSLATGALLIALTAPYWALEMYKGDLQFYILVLRNLWLLVAFALAASMLHASRNRISIYRVLSNLATSWLSREVFSALILLILLVAYSFLCLDRCTVFHCGYKLVLAVMAVITLTLTVKTYMMPSRPSWNHVSVFASTFLSAFLLGFPFLGLAHMVYALLGGFSIASDPTFIFSVKFPRPL